MLLAHIFGITFRAVWAPDFDLSRPGIASFITAFCRLGGPNVPSSQ
jgi:hypothetical protein